MEEHSLSLTCKPINKRFAHLIGNPDGADFWFDVLKDHTSIPAHKLFVAAGSQVLHRIVYGFEGCPAARPAERTTVDDISSESFREILRYLYTDVVGLTDANVIEILKKANYYGLDEIELQCEEHLVDSITLDNCIEIYSQLFGLVPFESIVRSCLTRILCCPKEMVFYRSNLGILDRDAMKSILSCDRINCDEYDLFAALLKWAQKQYLPPSDGAPEEPLSAKDLRLVCGGLEDCIRWSAVSMEEFDRMQEMAKGFYTPDEIKEMKRQIRDGTYGVTIKRRRLYYEHANWVPRPADMTTLPADAVCIGRAYRHANYVARKINARGRYYLINYTCIELGIDEDDDERAIEVLCGSGYDWMRVSRDGIPPDNFVALCTEPLELIARCCEDEQPACWIDPNTSLLRFNVNYDCGHAEDDDFEVLVARYDFRPLPQSIIPPEALAAPGSQYATDERPTYLGHAYLSGDILPVVIIPHENRAMGPWNTVENEILEYEYLRVSDGYDAVEWVHTRLTTPFAQAAVEGGRTEFGEILYFGRAMHNGRMVYGKVHRSHNRFYFGWNGAELGKEVSEVLLYKSKQVHKNLNNNRN